RLQRPAWKHDRIDQNGQAGLGSKRHPQRGKLVRMSAFDAVDTPQQTLMDKCVHCGFCLPSCPTYLLWGEEMDSPRGRIYLMRAGLEGRTDLSSKFVQHFDACLG